jgi:MtN3 and saliva related transmembrane protein
MVNPEWIGSAAGFLTTVAYLPQVIKTVRSRETGSLSVWMYASVCLGVTLWTVYGVMIDSMSVIVTNVVSLLLAGTVLAMKLRCG